MLWVYIESENDSPEEDRNFYISGVTEKLA